MIELMNVQKTFGGKKRKTHHALRNISASIKPGKVTALLGENGAGKTTLLRLIAGLYEVTLGEIQITGAKQSPQNLALRKDIGVLFGGDTGLYKRLTAREHLKYYASLYNIPKQEAKQRIERLSHELGMREFMDRRVHGFSKGMRQKVAIGRAMIHDPSIYLLDEPTTGLDITAANMFREKVMQLQREEKTIIFSTHLMEEVKMLCDHVLILYHGQLLFDGPLQALYEEEETDDLNMIMMAKLARGGRPL